jgi:hypothetical protein
MVYYCVYNNPPVKHILNYFNPIHSLKALLFTIHSRKDSSPLKIGPIGCPLTFVRNYHYTLRNSPEKRISCLYVSYYSK